MKRKHISWKTRCAAALIAPCRNCGYALLLYDDAKKMTEDQLLSLLHWDHNILHETGHEDVDKYWNLTPLLIKEHREKTKTDAAIIAKGRRIRFKDTWLQIDAELRKEVGNDKALVEVAREAYWAGRCQGAEQANKSWSEEANRPGGALQWRKPRRKLRSRGFDKTKRRKMDGTVVKR